MKTKRLLPLILAAATAVGVLAGCKTGGTPAQTSGTTGGTEEKPMPKLTSLSVDGENIAFDPDTNPPAKRKEKRRSRFPHRAWITATPSLS